MRSLILPAALASLALAACDAVSPNRPPSMATLKQEIATWSPAQKTLEAERVTSAFFALTPAARANYLAKSDSGVLMRDFDDTVLGEGRVHIASSYGALIAPTVMAYQFNLADGRSFGGVTQARKDTTGQPDLNIRKDDRTAEIRSCEDWVSQRVLEQLTVLRMTGNSDAASVKKNLPADDCSLWSAAPALPKAQEQAAPPPAPPPAHPATQEAAPLHIRCEITDTQSNFLTYDFIDAITPSNEAIPNVFAEAIFSKNGVSTTPAYDQKPYWDLAVDEAKQVAALWSRIDKGWDIAYFLPPSPYAGNASLFHDSNKLGTGRCFKPTDQTMPVAPQPSLPVPLPSKDSDIADAMVKATDGMFKAWGLPLRK
jgi:hypothetical protein